LSNQQLLSHLEEAALNVPSDLIALREQRLKEEERAKKLAERAKIRTIHCSAILKFCVNYFCLFFHQLNFSFCLFIN
jgi:hypothetical protein